MVQYIDGLTKPSSPCLLHADVSVTWDRGETIQLFFVARLLCSLQPATFHSRRSRLVRAPPVLCAASGPVRS